MLQVKINDAKLEAGFWCEFCGKSNRWPFPSRIIWKGTPEQQAYPDARHVIMSHYIGHPKFGFPECPMKAKWMDTVWELIDGDSETTLANGTVTMIDGWPRVE